MAGLASSLYQIDPETGLPIDPETGQPIQGATNPGAPVPAGSQSIYGSPQNAVIPGTISNPEAPMQNRYTQNGNIIASLGNQINNEAQYQMGYYGSQIPKYGTQMDEQLDALKNTPGYNADEASKIGVDYSQFNTTPGEYGDIKGDPSAALKVANAGAAGEGAMLNQYQGNLGGQVENYDKGVGGATDEFGDSLKGAVGQYGSGVKGAVGGLKSGLEGAQNWDMLNGAVNSEGLNFDPNGTEKQLTDADVQAMKTSAGTRIGNQYRSAEDTLERQAAEAGNTSPMALAAARSRLMSQESADQGDAEVNADIAAKQAQYQRAAGIENARLGSEQTKSGLKATAGTTQEAAAQSAAGLAGTADIAAQENVGGAGLSAANTLGSAKIQAAKDIGKAGIDAANQYGTTSIATQSDIANKQTAAQAQADAAASGRATTTANMRYGQGTGSAGATASGAKTIGDARQSGNSSLRSGIAGEQQLAQTGGNAAATQQNNAFATTAGGLNNAAAGQGSFINGKASFGDSLAGGFAKGVTGLLGAAAGGGGAAKGDIITEPQIRTIGEKGPEMVIPLGGRYRRYQRQAA